MPKIRVLFVIGQLAIGGTELQLLSLIENLNRNVFEVNLVSLSDASGSLHARFAAISCPPILLHREKSGRLSTILRLSGIVKNFNPDIIHAFAYASRAVVPAASLVASKARIIVSIRTQPDWQVAFWDRVFNQAVDLILTNSRESQHSIEKYWHKQPCRTIYNGLDIRRFRELLQLELLNVPEHASLHPDCRKIALVARLEPVKQVEMTLQAFHLLSGNPRNIQLWVVGAGSLMGELREVSGRLKIEHQVVFWGERENIPSILKFCSMGVLSSRVEGLSNSIIEYMAAGLPVVATDVGGNAELVVDGKTGFLVPPDDVDGMSAAMSALLGDENLASQLGQAGRRRIEVEFTVEHMVNGIETIYQTILSG